MLIEQLLDAEVLRSHVLNKLVSETPSRIWSNVRIYSYGRSVQYDPTLWDDVTEKCRGLIVDWDTGEVLARPFRKFFNIATSYRPETLRENLPATEPEVTRKLDGSLGILWRYDNDVHIATRGSFGSEQARWATRFFHKHYKDNFTRGWTPLFEIIYPENRIVVKYDREELVLIGMVNIETGEEMRHPQLAEEAARCGMPVVQLFNGKTLDTLGFEPEENEEGFVVTWHKTGESPLKLKVKFAEYMRIHKVVTGLSIKGLWEMMRDGISLEAEFGDLPSHFQEWADANSGMIRSRYDDILQRANVVWDSRPRVNDRKELALYFVQHGSPIPSVCFARLDGKDESECIWKACRPKPEDAFVTAVRES